MELNRFYSLRLQKASFGTESKVGVGAGVVIEAQRI